MQKTYKPLDELIDQTGMKKVAIAERLGIDYSTFYKWRVSPDTIGIDGIEKLSKITGRSFYDIYDVIKKFKEKVDLNATKTKSTN